MRYEVSDGAGSRLRHLLLSLLCLSAAGFSGAALAVPSFAQQTGMACERCHTTAYGPALTDYGRQFKLNGYVFGDNTPKVPVAFMALGGYTHTAAPLPAPASYKYSVNDNTSLDQLSLFVATAITSHLGLFSQFTWTGASHTMHWDNSDLRYARSFTVGNTALVTGVSVNNNPTVQDLWNSTPAWGFPWINSALAPRPSPTPYITTLAQTVLGATAYAMVDEHFYVEAGGYRGLSNNWLDKTGIGASANPNLSGIAPYWRAAVQASTGPHSYSVGTFGIDARVQPDPTQPQKDRYTDFGFDATYQYNGHGASAVAADVSLIHERQRLDAQFVNGASDAPGNYLQSAAFDLTYAYKRTYVATINGFISSGTTNVARYGAGPVTGNNTGEPSSKGYTLEAEYIPFGKSDSFLRPWLNLRLGLQYIHYLKFNGSTDNYDGSGRAARNNDTLFAYYWIII